MAKGDQVSGRNAWAGTTHSGTVVQVSQTLEGNSRTWGGWGLQSLAEDNTGRHGLKEQMEACRVVALGCLATGASSALILYKDTHKKWF